jgi:hypothetical protein
MTVNRLLFLIATVCIVAVSATSAMAQAVIFFNENGFSGGTFGPLPTGVGPDPLATGGPTFPTATLFYGLPFPVATGDLQLTEPPTGISDNVRFEGTSVFFYSDTLDGGEDLADVGLPLLLTSTPTVIAETGSEGSNSAIWTPPPGSGLPGAPPAGFPPVTYQIISDATPEPCSALLACLGGTALLLTARRRRRFQR